MDIRATGKEVVATHTDMAAMGTDMMVKSMGTFKNMATINNTKKFVMTIIRK